MGLQSLIVPVAIIGNPTSAFDDPGRRRPPNTLGTPRSGVGQAMRGAVTDHGPGHPSTNTDLAGWASAAGPPAGADGRSAALCRIRAGPVAFGRQVRERAVALERFS